ncbi:MAG: hypothetical protein R2864_11170 [Syntrophotaleaceae bacterium]
MAEWFNMTNPEVKRFGEQAPAMMVAEPLLIVRPLMQVDEERLAGVQGRRSAQLWGLKLDTVSVSGIRAELPCVTVSECERPPS